MNSLHIVCPHCLTVNRIEAVRQQHQPRCGRCKQPLFDGHPVELQAADFTRHIQRNDIPVLVDFWASWCGPCKMMAPAFAQAAIELEPFVRFAKVNTEQEQNLAAQYVIRSIPTLVLFRQGSEIARQSGAMGTDGIVSWVQSNI